MRSFILAALALPLLIAAAPAPSTVRYALSPEMKDGALQALTVEVRFRGDASGFTDFGWAQQWAGDHVLWRWARDVKVEGAQAVEHPSDGAWRIRAAPRAPLTVRYRVVSAYDHDPTTADSEQSRPVIRPTWFYSVGYALFGAPRSRLDAPATFEWRGGDSRLLFASDLEHLSTPGRRGARPGMVADVRQSIVIGGTDLKISGSLEGRDRVRVATLGDGTSPEFVALARRVIAMERRFWGDDGRAPFLVTASPLASDPAVQGFSGTGLTDAFALWLDDHATPDALRWLLAHEYFHTWNAVALGGFGSASTSAPAAWFSEGFTDYYARALLVRDGLIGPEEFAKLWSRTLHAYAASPVRNAPNSRIASDFWTDPAVGDLPYQRGAQLAALWNARMRRASAGRVGLDDVMHAQYAWAKAHPHAKTSAPELFVRTAWRLGFDLSADVERYVMRGEAIFLPKDVFGPCAVVGDKPAPTFERGFDPKATAAAGNIIQGMSPDSSAYAAGLRDGMRIVSRDSGEAGEPEVPYILQVDDHGTKRTIHYLPQGSGVKLRPEVRIEPGADPKVCARSLSGL